MRILVTGAAGFIGSELSLKLLERGETVFGIDNHNDYYDPALKEARLSRHLHHENYTHLRLDISDRDAIKQVFADYEPQRVVNLAAQAGVRYSIENPHTYIQSNILGFMNILEGCRHHGVEHLVYTSSSSVYGANTSMPFSVHDNVDRPLSLYAASKRSNELMAYTYSHLYGLPTTGLRFFTVYGPWGRPDMALFKFTRGIILGEKIPVFNSGNHMRDFTYIDDVIEGVFRVITKPLTSSSEARETETENCSAQNPWKIYNLGSNRPVKVMEFIKVIEKVVGRKAIIEKLPLQAGDILDTSANVDELIEDYQFKPNTDLRIGVERFVEWYFDYFDVA